MESRQRGPLHGSGQNCRSTCDSDDLELLKCNMQSADPSLDIWTPFQSAVIHEDVTEMIRLYKSEADVNSITVNEWTALSIATLKGNQELVQILLELGASARFIPGSLPPMLHASIYHGYHDIATMLVEHGADVTITWKDNFNPLNLAAMTGQREMAELFLEHGASPQLEASSGQTRSDVFVGSGSADVSPTSHGASTSVSGATANDVKPIHYAARNGHVDVVDLLINRGALINYQTLSGFTPLHFAAQNGHAQVAKLLIQSGARADLQTNELWTPMHYAAANGHLQIVKLLKLDRSIFGCKSVDGIRPVDLAASGGHYIIVQELMFWALCG